MLTAEDAQQSSPRQGEAPPKTRVQSIVTRLNLASGGEPPPREVQISPLCVDLYCNQQRETALHVAVRKRHYALAAALLKAGASANLPIRDTGQGSVSSALVEACANRDSQMVDLLLRHGARDDDCRALQVGSLSGESW